MDNLISLLREDEIPPLLTAREALIIVKYCVGMSSALDVKVPKGVINVKTIRKLII